MSSSRVNQQLIADKLNISHTTVSRCFTNHPGINPATRAKVFSLASKLGYHYMEQRRDTSNGRKQRPSKFVGVLICTEVEEFNRTDYESPGVELLPGITEFALLNKLQTDLHYVDPDETEIADKSYHRIPALRRRQWDGVLLVYPFPHTVLDKISQLFPCVSLVEQYGHSSLDCVDVDHYKGVSSLIDELFALGHQQIGYLMRSYQVEASWALRRYSAYVEKLSRHGLALNPKNTVGVAEPVDREQSHREAIQRSREGVTAWVCGADHQAYDLIAAFREAGIRVPQDVSVVGFDGIRKPAGMPQVTTIQVPFREIGFIAAKRLNDLMTKRFGSAQHILLECQMRQGETITEARKKPALA